MPQSASQRNSDAPEESCKALIDRLQLKAGVISDELRDALGLRGDEHPPNVLAMRRVGVLKGYPPGWLEIAAQKQARGAHERLTMVTHRPDDELRAEEDGEIAEGLHIPFSPHRLQCFNRILMSRS